MRRALLFLPLPLLLAFVGVTPVRATGEDGPRAEAPSLAVRPSPAALKKELVEVIDAQLAAFRADDFAKAYSFAAAEIRTLYPAKDFENMVRSAYPIIAKSGQVEYGLSFDQGDKAIVNVRIADKTNKSSAQYRYLFKKEASGWKIVGVTEIESVGLSV